MGSNYRCFSQSKRLLIGDETTDGHRPTEKHHVGQEVNQQKQVSVCLRDVPEDHSSFPVPSHCQESQQLTFILSPPKSQCSFQPDSSGSFNGTGIW